MSDDPEKSLWNIFMNRLLELPIKVSPTEGHRSWDSCVAAKDNGETQLVIHRDFFEDLVHDLVLSSEVLPTPDQLVRHHSGRIYKILQITNTDSTDEAKFPVTIVYQDVDSGKVWSRPWSEFKHKFKTNVNV